MSAFRLAGNFGDRVAELREILRETQDEFGRRWLARGKQVSVWENGGQKPPARKVREVAAAQRWPIEIFAEGGPMPSELVNRPLAGRTVHEAAAYYGTTLERLRRASGQPIMAEEARGMIERLWELARIEAPELTPGAAPPASELANLLEAARTAEGPDKGQDRGA